MSFIAPLWLAVAGMVAAGVVLAHLFRRTVPPQDVLPTVRFVPEGAPVAVLRSRRPDDLLLLLMRLAIVALLGMALAGAHVAPGSPARIVLVDASRAVATNAALADSALAAGEGAEFVVFDSVARRVARDEIRETRPSGARGALSAALVVANRMVSSTADGGRSTELVIVSPLAREEVDSAVTALLAMWPGHLRVVRVPVATEPTRAWTVRAAGDDPVAAALTPSPRGGGVVTRIVRGTATPADSVWARNGGALVVWPTDLAVVDTIGGIAAGNQVVVGRFARAHVAPGGTPVARWVDGATAATEQSFGLGCIRNVAIPVDPVGDVVLRESFRGIARALAEPCGGARDFRLATLPGSGSRVPVLGASIAGTLPILLALAALALLVAEHVVRSRRQHP